MTDVKVVTEGATARVDIEAVGPLRYRTQWLDQPSRLLLDFDDATYAARSARLTVAIGALTEVWGTQYQPNVARVVVRFTRPAHYVLRERAGGLSIDIRVVDARMESKTAGDETTLHSTPRAVSSPTAGDATPPSPPRSSPPVAIDGGHPALPPAGRVAAAGAATDAAPAATPPGAAAAGDNGPSAGGSGAYDLERLKQAIEQMRVASEPTTEPELREVGLTLQESIDVALKENLSVRIARLAKESAELSIPRAWAAFNPTVGYSLTASGQRSVVTGVPDTRTNTQSLQPFATELLPTATTLALTGNFSRFGLDAPPPSQETFGSGITLSVIQPLLRGGRIFVATQPVRNAEFDLRVAEESLRSQVVNVTAQTKRAYYTMLLSEKVIEVIQAALERDKTLIEASNALFQARLVTKRDVYSAELIHAQDSARLVSARADLESSHNAFLNVLGLPIGTEVRLLDREVKFEPIPLEQDRWIASAFKDRPEILALEQQLAKSALNVLVAQNAVLPQLDLVTSYGRAQTDTTVPRSLGLGGDSWSVGVVFSIPIGNVAAKSALTQARLARASLEAQLSDTKRQVELDVRAAVIKLRTSVESMKQLALQIDQAKGKLEVGRAQFVLGKATNLDITDAQQALLNAETDLLTAIVNYNIGLAQLQAALGRVGGPL